MFEVAYYTDKGAILESSDDRLFINGDVVSSGSSVVLCKGSCLIGVCDGVGGEAYGYEAAGIVASELRTLMNCMVTKGSIESFVRSANEAILFAQKVPGHSRMATTLVGLFVDDSRVISFNIGDSRAYRYRYPYISQMSIDHTLIKEHQELGLPINDRQEHVITRFLGGDKAIPAVYESGTAPEDDSVFLLCSDGISDVLSNSDLESILSSGLSAEELCFSIVNAALKNKSEDNISAIIVKRLNS